MNESRNRAFLYGESVFTTMRMVNDHIRDWEAHFERLKRGVEFVYGPFKEDDWAMELKNRLETRCQNENGDKILRLTIYTEQDRGLQRPGVISTSELKIHLASSFFDPARFDPLKPLSLRTCPAFIRPSWWPSFLKAGNYLETILSQKKYMQPGDDDVLFLSEDDQALESSVANIFIFRDGKLYTAPLGPNVLDGVARRKVLSSGESIFGEIQEESSSISQIRSSDGIFGSNSIRGLFLIGKIDDYDLSLSEEFKVKFDSLRSTIWHEKN